MWSSRRERIQHDGPRTLWAQIADDIRADITSGQLRSGAKLPGILELADLYGVSDRTIRRVLLELGKDGTVTVVNGRGTYVK
ncbi:winged helix-turn-helix domain-containing protein [Saccharomonospora sp. NPDC006951]